MAGSNAVVTVQVEESPDQIHWQNKNVSPEIQTGVLSLKVPTRVQGREDGALPASGYVRLKVQVGGLFTTADVQVWVTVRAEEGAT